MKSPARRPRPRRLRAAIAALAAALLLAASVGTAHAAAGPAAPGGREDLLTALGIGDVGVDYLVLVDQSLSMGDAGYDTAVRTEVKKLIDGMRSVDRVGFISFAVQPGTQKKFVQAAEAKSLLDGLAVDDPGGTNLGLALASAADLIDKTPLDNPPRPVGVVLLSDAKEDVPAGQPYAKIDPSSPEWKALRAHFDKIGAQRDIAGFGVDFEQGADVVYKAISTVLSSIPAGHAKTVPELSGPLQEWAGQARAKQGAAAVDAEKGKGVEARWIVPDTLDGTFDVSSNVPLVLELKATTARVPVRVSDLAVSGAQVSGLPADPVIVDPKAPPVRINVTMSAARTRTGLGGGTSTVEVRPRVTGTVDSPLGPAVTQYLNRPLALATDITNVPPSPPVKLTGKETTERASWMTAGIVIVIIAALILAVGGTLYVIPRKMQGELDVWSYDGTYSMVVGVDGERSVARTPLSRIQDPGWISVRGGQGFGRRGRTLRIQCSRGGNVGGIRMAEGGKGVVAGLDVQHRKWTRPTGGGPAAG